MEFNMNEGHPVEVEVGGRRYARHAIHTRFVEIGESYLDLIREYVLPVWQPGDLLSSSEKVVALCQGRVVYEKDVKPGLLARFLAPFASGTPDAFGVKHPAKMQFAINECGAARVLWAAICAGAAKLFGRTGVFYEMTGREVAGLRCRACGSEARAACRGAHRDGLPRGASGRSGCAPRAFGADGEPLGIRAPAGRGPPHLAGASHATSS